MKFGKTQDKVLKIYILEHLNRLNKSFQNSSHFFVIFVKILE